MEDKITELKFNRFKDAEWFDTDKKIVLIGGAGGIGSWLSLLLTRAGFMPYVYDFDTVEEHNLGGQLFSTNYIGEPKVNALNGIILDLTGERIEIFNQKVDLETPSNNFVFSGFDNMQARKDLFENWVESNINNENRALFMDGRLTMEQMQIFCVRNNQEDIENYRKNLFDDSEVPDAPCTARQTSHAAAMIASHMVSFFVNHLTNIKFNTQKRSVPFFWEYYLPLDRVEYNPYEE